MRTLAFVLAAFANPLFLNGCSTYMCLNTNSKPIYGGTRLDAQVAVYACGIGCGINPTEPDAPDRLMAFAVSTSALADLPFSLVADTVTLPVTVWATCNQMAARPQEEK